MDLSSKQNRELLENCDTAYLGRLIKHGLKLEFAPPAITLERLHTIYAPRRFIPGVNPCTSHPLAAAHLRVAVDAAHKWAKDNRPVIEIGPSLVTHARLAQNNAHDVHACCKVSDPRDFARHAQAAASRHVRGCRDRDFTHCVSHAAMGLETERICVSGFEKCQAEAPFAFAVHSLYDVSLKDFAIGMHNHGTVVAKAWMHFPVEALYAPAFHNQQDDYMYRRYNTNNKTRDFNANWRESDRIETLPGDRITFEFPNDASFSYDHDFKTWFDWLLVGGFETPFGFSVLIEKTYRNGSQFALTITRAHGTGSLRQRIPSNMNEIVRLPDFVDMAKNGFCPNRPVKFLFMERDKIARLYHYILAREEKQFTFNTALAYARSELRAVRLGTQLIDKRWDIDCNEFLAAVCATFILARLQRMRANMTMNLVDAKTKELMQGRGFFARIFTTPDFLRRIFHSVNHLFGSCEVPTLLSEETQSMMAHLTMKFFDSIHTVDKLDGEESVIIPINFRHIANQQDLEQQCPPTVAEVLARVETVKEKQESKTHYVHEFAASIGLKYTPPATITQAGKIALLHVEQHDTLVEELRRGAAASEGVLASLLKEAHKCAESSEPVEFDPENFAMIQGVPGAGKTSRCFGELLTNWEAENPGGKMLAVGPTKDLVASLSAKLRPPHSARTPHMALVLLKNKRVKPDLIIVDEAFTFPLALLTLYSSYAPVILLGDSNQIGHIDFSGLWGSSTPLTEVAKFIPTEHLMETHRCPQDVVALPFIARMYPGISSDSLRGTAMDGQRGPSIHYQGPDFKSKTSQVIVFTQDQKERHKDEGARTVHEVQGQTFTSVVLHVGGTAGERALLRDSPNHLVVALTRHTTNLFVRECENGLLATYMNQDPTLAILADDSNTNVDAPEPQAPDIERMFTVENLTEGKDPPYVPAQADVALSTRLLAQIYPTEAIIEEHFSVVTTSFSNGGGASGVLRPDEIHQDAITDTKSHLVYRFPTPQRVKITSSSQKAFSVKTLMDRYSKRTKNLTGSDLKKEAATLFKALQRNVNYAPHPEWQGQVYLEAIEKFQARGHDITDLRDIDCWTDQGASQVKFCIKQQQKPDLTFSPGTKDKAGQGIAAWSKTLNFTMIVWTRMLEKILTHNSQRSFHFMTKYTDSECLQFLDSIQHERDASSLEYFEGDWTEFDSSQNNVEHALFCLQLRAIGCPKSLVHRFASMMDRRGVSCPLASVIVENKKDSGRVDTLVGNTTFNAAVLLNLIQGDILHTLWKGDDSLIIGRGLRMDPAKSKYYESSCGYKIKAATGPSAEFVSFILNVNGAALNIPKLAAKVISRCYSGQEDFVKYQLAIKDLLKTTKDTTTAAYMCQVNAAHHRVNREDIDNLLSVLRRFATGDFEFDQLVKFERNHLIYGDMNPHDSVAGLRAEGFYSDNEHLPATPSPRFQAQNL